MTIEGAIISAARQVAIERLDAKPEPRDVHVADVACGLCTWEQRVYRGVKPTYPFWGGHEVCGTVVGLGDDPPPGLAVGDRVAVALMRRCGRCVYCRRGLDNHCAYVRPAGFDGLPAGPRGLSDRLSVPPYQVFRLAGTVGRTGGALVEPLACVLRSVRMARPSPARLALVLGAGTMGLIHAAVLTHLGSRVLVADQDRTLIEHAERMGFEAMVLSSDEELRRHVRAMSDDDGAETVFCIRGGTTAVQLGATAVARGGRLMLFQSIPPSDAVVLSANDLHYREVQMIGTISQTLADFQAAVDLLSSLPNLLSCLITQAVPASNVRDAFELALEHRVNRVLVTFGDAQSASPA